MYARDRMVPRLRRESHRALAPGEPLVQYHHDVACQEDGCAARLSRYNPSPRCSVHHGWQDTVSRSYG